MTEHEVIKSDFVKQYSEDFSGTVMEDAKLMPDNVLQVSRRYLRSFLRYREIPGVVRICPPHSTLAGRGVGGIYDIKVHIDYLNFFSDHHELK